MVTPCCHSPMCFSNRTIALLSATAVVLIALSILCFTELLPGTNKITGMGVLALGLVPLSLAVVLRCLKKPEQVEVESVQTITFQTAETEVPLGELIEDEESFRIHGKTYKTLQKLGNLDPSAPPMLRANSQLLALPLPSIVVYGLGRENDLYPSLAIQLPNTQRSRLPEWLQQQPHLEGAALYFLLFDEFFPLQEQKRNFYVHNVVLAGYNHEEWKVANIDVAISAPVGIEATEEIKEDKWNEQLVILHKSSDGFSICYSPDNMHFKLLKQEVCEGFFAVHWGGQAAVFHVVILRSGLFGTRVSSDIMLAFDGAHTVQEFIHTVDQSQTPHKDSILRTLRGITA